MKIYKNIHADDWGEMVKRPARDMHEIEQRVLPVLHAVKSEGDAALRKYTYEFDGVMQDALEVSQDEIIKAADLVSEDLKAAIQQAKSNIEKFHAAQREQCLEIETMPGVRCWRRSIPIQKIGLYVPGGTAPLFSTVLMLSIPAMVAGCAEIIICTPPQKDNTVHPAILYTANLCGVHKIYKVGGSQAIAAMAYGTETVPKVYKIFGPGNQYVAIAKQLVNRQGVAIDLFAGPSEVLIVADGTADPKYITIDLLAQAEHGIDSHCILVATSEELLYQVQSEISAQVMKSTRKEILQQSIQNFQLILVNDIREAIAFSNTYAPEHLIIVTANAATVAEDIYNAGSVFIGHYTPVSIGDYASGTNHTLPTNGTAVAYSGVSLDSFLKKVTFQEASLEGLQNIGPTVQLMADAERLPAHRDAIAVRLANKEFNKLL